MRKLIASILAFLSFAPFAVLAHERPARDERPARSEVREERPALPDADRERALREDRPEESGESET